jgi:hypothetical protein
MNSNEIISFGSRVLMGAIVAAGAFLIFYLALNILAALLLIALIIVVCAFVFGLLNKLFLKLQR